MAGPETAATILHVVPYDEARGAQRFARDLADGLDARGHVNTVLTLFEAPDTLLEADMSLGVKRGMWRGFGLDPRVVFRLRSALVEACPMLVIAHGGESAKYMALAARPGTPWIYLRIGTAGEALKGRARRWIHDFYTQKAEVIVSVSNDVADEAASLTRAPRDEIVVIPNGRDPGEYQPNPRPGRDEVNATFVGHLVAGKRPEWFLDAIESLRAQGLPVHGVLVGDGPLGDSLRPRAEASGVTMLGVRTDVPDLLSASDVFVFTSMPSGEGMPGVLIEAGLSGLATVSTRVPGASDVIEDGVTGFLVDIDDKDGLIMRLSELVADADMRRRMGEAARARCVELFAMTSVVNDWDKLLEAITRGRSRCGSVAD